MISDTPQTQRERLLGMIQEKYPGYHPLLSIADIANDPNPEIDVRTKLSCHQTIIRFVESELKSVEVKAQIIEDKTIRVSLFEGEYEVVPDAPALECVQEAVVDGFAEYRELEDLDQL